MKVGDLVRVNETYAIPFVGIVLAVNSIGGALVRSPDGSREVWAYDWFAEVLNESG
mgnify:FL=1|jgi:hypothetical protein